MFNARFVKSQYRNLPIPPASKFTGRTYVVTGASTGLGYECAKHLVRLGAERVILGVRSQAKGDVAKANIECETGRTGVADVWLVELQSYDSVKAFAKRACEELERVDGVIENASLGKFEWSVSEGLETTLTVNVVSTFLLAVLLLPRLKADAKRLGIVPHLVIVGSAAGFMSAAGILESIEGNIIDGLNVEGQGPRAGTRYAVSKLIQSYATRQLALLLPPDSTGVVINYLSPGLCNTGLVRESPLAFRLYLGFVMLLIGRTGEMGSRTLIHAVCAGSESHGRQLRDCGLDSDGVPEWVASDEGKKMQEQVWRDIADRLEGIEPGCIRNALKT